MGSGCSISIPFLLWLLGTLATSFPSISVADNTAIGKQIGPDFTVTWSNGNVETPDGGRTVQLALDYSSGSAIGSVKKFQYGSFSAEMKLVPGNSAGTLATFYLKSTQSSPVHDELDFEFLGNSSGQPYALQTNIFAANTFGREQRTFLWFDPTADYHRYSLVWNPHMITFSVDSTPIRIFPNNNGLGVAYPYNPMRVYTTIYNADDWVTQGGKVKIDWRNAPFRIMLRNIQMEGCPVDEMSCSEAWQGAQWWNQPRYWSLSSSQVAQLQNAQQRYMTYNYCTDSARYPRPPPECSST